jgi:hypothetical protein
MATDDRLFTVGEEVKIKGGCPHVWMVYALWSPTSVHIHRWVDATEKFEAKTFMDPALLVRV